jgi:hypothetical protein
MLVLKAHVRNGRLLLDEPTDLPEGDVVHLQQVDAATDEGMSDEEREDLLQALDEAIESVRPPEDANQGELGALELDPLESKESEQV